MAGLAKLSRLKSLRTKRELTQEDIAEALGVGKPEVARWDKDLSGISDTHLRDLAVVLDASVDAIRGHEIPYEEQANSPFAIDRGLDAAYGTLRLEFASHASEYPIDEKARVRLLEQLANWDVQQSGNDSAWLYTWSMDNKIIFANRDYLSQVELVGDDAVQMPGYEHPEVYSALSTWELDDESDRGRVLLERCNAVIAQQGQDEAIQAATCARVVSADGRESWHFMLRDDDALGFFILELEAMTAISRNRFLRVISEGYYRDRYINLSQTALIEIPADRYHRLNAESAASAP